MLVDLSSSMMEYLNPNNYTAPGAFGVTPQTKLEAVKDAIRNFVKTRSGDRVGTIVFSEHPYVVSPLTLDYRYVSSYLDMVDPKTLTGEGKTAIGEAVYAGMKLIRWKDPKAESKAAILVFTDGENNSGRSIYEALATARQEKIPVYLVGLQIWYLSDAENLKQALASTGGQFFDVQDPGQLKQAYQTVDSLERQDLYTDLYLRNSPLYHPFVAAALALLFCTCLLRAFPYFIAAE
jgi:Ca-activated chloride channel family protein